MIFEPTAIQGANVIRLQPYEDERGFFARSWCANEFAEHGLMDRPVQMNVSFNRRKHTLRGFHYQVAPHRESKLLRCVRGSVLDVVLDLRPESPTYRQHLSVVLSASNHRMVIVPEGCANAFLTLENDTEVTYLVSAFYAPVAERGVRWDDPSLGIDWPVSRPAVISEKDRSWPDLTA